MTQNFHIQKLSFYTTQLLSMFRPSSPLSAGQAKVSIFMLNYPIACDFSDLFFLDEQMFSLLCLGLPEVHFTINSCLPFWVYTAWYENVCGITNITRHIHINTQSKSMLAFICTVRSDKKSKFYKFFEENLPCQPSTTRYSGENMCNTCRSFQLRVFVSLSFPLVCRLAAWSVGRSVGLFIFCSVFRFCILVALFDGCYYMLCSRLSYPSVANIYFTYSFSSQITFVHVYKYIYKMNGVGFMPRHSTKKVSSQPTQRERE